MWVTPAAPVGCGFAAGVIAERPDLDQNLSAAWTEYEWPFQVPARSAGPSFFPACMRKIDTPVLTENEAVRYRARRHSAPISDRRVLSKRSGGRTES
jgi:hypothetical protein